MRSSAGLAGALVFVACSVLTATCLGILFGSLSTPIAIASFALGAVGAVLALKHCSREPLDAPSHWLEWFAISVFIVVTLRAFLWLVYTDGDQLMVLSPNNLGDLTKHWNFLRYMASAARFWPDNPLIAGGTIHYPIGADLFNSLLLLCGIDIIRGLVWVGLIGCLLGGAALFTWGRAFGLIGLLCNGGLAGFSFLALGVLRDWQSDLAWKNLFLSIIVTQRGFLFCLPAGLLLLESWRKRWRNTPHALPFWVEAVLYASMPVFHVHTFMFLSLLIGSWICFSPTRIRGHFLKLGLASLIPATLLMLLVTDCFRGASFIRFHPGWMQNDSSCIGFWGTNFGMLIPLCLILCWILIHEKDDVTALAFVLPSCLIFLLCCFVLFAPWDWDNTKLMIWSYLTVLPFLWGNLIKRFDPWIRALLCLLLFLSGFVSLLGGLKAGGYTIADRSELDALELPLRTIPLSARFACSTAFNHPLLLLGRNVAVAYPGYLFGHGIPWEEAENNLSVLMNGESGWEEAAKALEATYLFWGPREIAAFPNSSQSWARADTVTASGSWGVLYELKR